MLTTFVYVHLQSTATYVSMLLAILEIFLSQISSP